MSTTKPGAYTLQEQKIGVETLIAASRAQMTRGGASAEEMANLLGPAQRAVATLQWLLDNRSAVVAAAGFL